MKSRYLVLALSIIVLASAILIGQQKTASSALPADSGKASRGEGTALNETPLRLPLANPHVIVKKNERRLLLFDGDKLLRTYRIGLGFAPSGDKTRQGDGRTPEGSFYVCVKNAASQFYLSLGLSYPNQEHAERGLREGRINRAQHAEIISALNRKQRPPWNTALGGEIFVHGNGSSSDWTWGCVALDNPNIKELFDAIPKGTAVVIEP